MPLHSSLNNSVISTGQYVSKYESNLYVGKC